MGRSIAGARRSARLYTRAALPRPPEKTARSKSRPKTVRQKPEPIVHLRRDRKAFAQAQAEAKAEEGPPPERRERRSLTHVGGRVDIRGADAGFAAALEGALKVPREEDSTRAHVHGFHSYAARLHPLTARRLIECLSVKGETVLDPFMGSGTVLVEARLLERRGVGADLNPLSIELAHLKTRGTTAAERQELLEAGDRAMQHAEDRRLSKAGPTIRYGKEDTDLFDIHMLLELDGLKDGIRLEQDGFAREALKLVFSSILVKVSRQPGDTVQRVSPRRLATGFAIKLFSQKTQELAERLEEYARLLPPGVPEVRLQVDDARKLSSVAPGSVHLVVTSPPYPGVYDYAHHHAARLRWLGMDVDTFERQEIGSRRKLRAASRDEGIKEWRDDFVESLRAIRRTLLPGGAAVLVLADSVVQKQPLYAEDVIEDLARNSQFELVATASQKRPHFHEPSIDAFRRRPRREHLFVLSAPKK
jgi:hypothetical protein